MADYKATDTEFTSVANAIRTKGGGAGLLTWPNGFVSAIQNIPSGSGPEYHENAIKKWYFGDFEEGESITNDFAQWSNYGQMIVDNGGVRFRNPYSSGSSVYQVLRINNYITPIPSIDGVLEGRPITASVLFADGTLLTQTETYHTASPSGQISIEIEPNVLYFGANRDGANALGVFFYLPGYTTYEGTPIAAVKFEAAASQSLAYYDGSKYVLLRPYDPFPDGLIRST